MAAGAAAPVQFHLGGQSLADALVAFSLQAKVEVLFSYDELNAVQAPSLSARIEPDQALSRLLEGSGFFAERTHAGKYVIRRARVAGAIRGRVVSPSGRPLAGVRVTIPAAELVTTTDANGRFAFAAVPPGAYELAITAAGFRPLQIVDVRATADLTLNLETQTLQPADPVVHLAPQVVQGRYFRHWKDLGPDAYRPQQAGGNLDLPRTADDALPYTIYDRDQISRSGAASLNEYLRRELIDSDPITRPPEQNGSTNDLNAFLTGSPNLALRGFGSDETVILVNGRRLPEAQVGGIAAFNSPPDVNFIPLNLVERVEVLPVSAAALYTGNPVGGVINIVLRPDANGTELVTSYTNALGRYDAPTSSVSLQHGETLLGGRLHLRLSATLTQTMPPNESELGYIQANDLAAVAPLTTGLHRATPNVRSSDLSPLFGPGSSPVTSVAPGADGSGGLAAFQGREGLRNLALFDTPGSLANSPESRDYAYGRRQRSPSLYLSAVYDVWPSLQLGLDALYSRTVINRGYNVFAGDLMLAKDSPLNPFGQDVVVSLNEVAPGLGENYGEARVDLYSLVGGLIVKLPADWRVSGDLQYAHSLTRYRGLAGVDDARWQELVDEGLYNPLRDTQVHGPPAAFYDRALIYYGSRGQFVRLGDYDTVDAAFRVTNQSFSLPTGSGAINVGGDFRLNRLLGYNDVRRYGDGTLQQPVSQWAGRTIERMSAFAELQAPLLPAAWLPSWVRAFDTDLAARYTAADTAAESNLAPMAGLKIDLAGGVALRASVSTANRLPTPFLSKLVATPGGPGGGPVSTVSIYDPKRDETYNVEASDALNPNLRTESDVTKAVGVLFQRGRVHRFRLAIDFADTHKSGEIVSLYPEAVVLLEDTLTGRVTRAAPASGDTHSVGPITHLLTGSMNLAWRHSQNWNTSFDYEWTKCFSGRLDLYARWSYFPRYDLELLPDLPIVDEIGAPDGALSSGLLKHRVNFGGSWSNRNYGFGLEGEYYHSRQLPVAEWATQHRRQVNPYWQFDAYVQADLGRLLPHWPKRLGLHGQLRIDNLLDARPPRYANDPSGSGYQSYGDWRRQTGTLTLRVSY